jgi:hypothetical protein
METQYARLDELREVQPEIVKTLMAAPLREKNPVREVVIGFYAYGLWRSGYVRRRLFDIWVHQGWRTIPMEKAGRTASVKQ